MSDTDYSSWVPKQTVDVQAPAQQSDFSSWIPSNHPSSSASSNQQMVGDVPFDPSQWGKQPQSENSSGLWSRIKEDVGSVWRPPLGIEGTSGPLRWGTGALDAAGRALISTPIALATNIEASTVPDAAMKALGYDPATGRSKYAHGMQDLANAALIESSRATSPLSPEIPVDDAVESAVDLAQKGAGKAGNAVTDVIGGIGTHTGGESIRQAAKAGYEGGDAGEAFLDAMRGNANMEDVVDKAKAAVSQMRQDRSAAYRSGMMDISNDKNVLDFSGIDKALNNISDVNVYKGRPINPDTSVLKQLSDSVGEWRDADPAEFHTPEGLDALKQRIGAIRDNTMPNTRDRLMTDRLYNSVKDTITDQAPTYADTMADYEKASGLIKDIENSLSLREKASADTSLRKLQSVMRNNVNTNYGNRLALAQQLNDIDPTILPSLAGQSMSSLTPRGLGPIVAGLSGGAGLYAHNPYLLGTLPFQSPRLMGEGAYLLGRGARAVEPFLPTAENIGAAAQAYSPVAAAKSGLIPNQNTTYSGQ